MGLFRFFNQFSKKRSSWFLLMLTTLVFLSFSLYFQHILQLSPCILCIYQRIAIVIILLASLLGLLAPKSFLRPIAILLWLLASLYGLFESIALVDIQFYPSLTNMCPLSIDYPSWLPLQNWLPSVFAPEGECSERVWQFLSLEMSQWTVIIFSCYLVMSVVALIGQFTKPKRNWWR